MASRRFSLSGTVTIAAMLVVGAAVLIPMVESNRRVERNIKDQAQVETILKGFVTFASNGQAMYPLPSQLDMDNSTVPEAGESKDTTANTLSVSVFCGLFSADVLISPVEPSADTVQLMRNYAYNTPPTAVVPANALWDPAFRGTPIEPLRQPGGARDPAKSGPSNQSYAYVVRTGKRRNVWTDTYGATDAVISSRGPTYSPGDACPSPPDGVWTLAEGELGERSRTLRMYGEKGAWRGLVGYNDLHVTLEQSPTPPGLVYRRPHGYQSAEVPDNIFVDESDETAQGNFAKPVNSDSRYNAYLRPVAEIKDGQHRVWRD